MTHYAQDFINLLDKIKPSKHRYEIFNDWLVLASATLYSTWKKDKNVEEEYLETAKQYTVDELQQLSELLAITVNALEEKEHDFLGEVFTLGELTNSRTGQFFTPFYISHFMAKAAIGEKDCQTNRVIRMIDPCCGAGGMLIAGALALKERGINYQQDAFFMGTDIDHRCARMTFIQLSLLAAPAVITCGNTLSFETYWQRETIGYHMAGMDFRLRAEKILDIISKPELQDAEIREDKTETKAITLPSSHEYVQRELFVMEEVI
jgi:type I restriction-modification system DNA methylase subunit